MSWSISKTGTPGELLDALHACGGSLTGMSQDEFYRAYPHIEALIARNFRPPEIGPIYLSLDAHGHGRISMDDGSEIESNCIVSLRPAPPPQS